MRNFVRFILVISSLLATGFIFLAYADGSNGYNVGIVMAEIYAAIAYLGSVNSPADLALLLIVVWFIAGVGWYAYHRSSWLMITTGYAGAILFVLGLFILASLAERSGAEIGLGALLNDETLPSWLYAQLDVFRQTYSLITSGAKEVASGSRIAGFTMLLGSLLFWLAPYVVQESKPGFQAIREMIADR